MTPDEEMRMAHLEYVLKAARNVDDDAIFSPPADYMLVRPDLIVALHHAVRAVDAHQTRP